MNSKKFATQPTEFNVAMNLKEEQKKAKPAQRRFEPELIGEMKRIVSKYTDVPHLLDHIETLSDNTDINFIKELNIDSVDVVEIVVDIEEKFGITIADQEITSFRSFGDMYDLVESKLSTLTATIDDLQKKS